MSDFGAPSGRIKKDTKAHSNTDKGLQIYVKYKNENYNNSC